TEGLLYLTSEEVAKSCREVDVVSCVADALRRHQAGKARVADEAALYWQPTPGGTARTLNMPAYLDGATPLVGTKVINANTSNPSRGLPRADGLVLLFDPVTARPTAILQAAEISAARTAAAS